MKRYVLALITIILCVAITYGQKRRDDNKKERTAMHQQDPCVIPLPAVTGDLTAPVALNIIKDQKCVIPGTNIKAAPPTTVRPFSNPRGYPQPTLSIQIKLAKSVIYDLKDLKFTLDMANNTSRKQTFLFDRHTADGTFLFGAACYITNSKNQSILKYVNKAIFDTANYYKKLDSYYYTLQPSEWLKKQFAVKDLVVLDSSICKKGRIPRDRYTLRLVFQNNYSNEVEFTAE